MSAATDRVLTALSTAGYAPKQRGRGWQALCPAHDDHDPSLDIDEAPNGNALLICRSHNCPTERICAAIGILPSALFVEAQSLNGRGPRRPRDVPPDAIHTEYVYCDANGRSLWYRDRWDWTVGSERKKTCLPRRPDGRVRGVAPVPYRLPQLLRAIMAGETVILCEGEKAADALVQYGYQATTTGPSTSWRSDYAHHFRGGRVVLWPDNDEPGETYVAAAAADLAEVTAELRVVRPRDLPPGGDAVDYFARGGTAESLNALIADAPAWGQASDTAHAAIATVDAPAWRTLADIDDSPPGDLLLGMLEPDGPNLLYGGGGVGKGSTCAWIIGRCLEQGIRPMIYDAERHPREWRRRTSGLGVEPTQVVYRDPSELPGGLMGQPLHLVVPHLGEIAHAAGCGILFVDSILAAANLSEEGLKSDARAPYQYVAALGELGIPSVSIGHTPKNTPEGDPYGSVSWINAMRLTWLGTRAEGEGHRVRWTPRKRNERGQIPGLLLSFLYDGTGRLCSVRQEDDERATRLWITDALVSGPRTVDDLAEEMAETDDGPHAAAVARAKDRIRQQLGRMRRAGLAHKTGGRGSPWALGCPNKVSRNGLCDGGEREE